MTTLAALNTFPINASWQLEGEVDVSPVWLVNALTDPVNLDTMASAGLRVWDIATDTQYVRSGDNTTWNTTSVSFTAPHITMYVYLGSVDKAAADAWLDSKSAYNKLLFEENVV